MFASKPPTCTGRTLALSRKDSDIRYLRHLGNSDIAKYVYRRGYGQLSHPYSEGLPAPPRYELYDLRTDPHEQLNLADDAVSVVEDHQRLIRDLLPDRSFLRAADDRNAGVEIRTDEALINRLRSLGYIR